MIEDAVDALVECAPAGMAFDGLTASQTDDGYRFAVPGLERTGLDAAEFRDLAGSHSEYVSEWYFWQEVAPAEPAHWAFLRWLEGPDERPVPERREALSEGVAREWGQLHVSVGESEAGRREYAVCHVDDADTAMDELDAYHDPATVTELTRTDDRGNFRPLSTAPTLARGWVFPALDADAVVRVVDGVYPATIANWHREREGRLDVTHWRETAERQTGIYDVVDELAGEQVEWLARACCVDSQCCKRREWDETADQSLDVPRGEGVFPCREPCSLVVAAAREFVLADRESDERVDVSLTAADRAQLARILEAVAEGEASSIRDGDLGDGANRLRARYLRAKLADEDAGLVDDPSPGDPDGEE